MDIRDGLNPQQLAAVEHNEGPLLVVAGAGTGKTQVITRRIARLILEGRAQPGQVLALTFTEKAAREMAERLYDLIGWQSFQVPVMTFNAFGSELLARYAHHSGRRIQGGLLNETQKTLLLKQRFSSISPRYFTVTNDLYGLVERIVGYIGRLQNAQVSASDYRSYINELENNPGDLSAADVDEQRDLAASYELYEVIKAETGTFDYYDQLALPLQLLSERPHLAQRLAKEYRYVLVDEYQDTSPIQDALLRSFIGSSGNLFAVGDDDQSIYGFRGADIENILAFTEHFKVKLPVALVQNYRSGQPILDAAYRLIKGNDPERLEARLGLSKRLIGQTDEAVVSFRSYPTPDSEQSEVVGEVEARLAAGEPPSSIAILARSNEALRGYAKALRLREVPYAISTHLDIFEQREVISLWYLLNWLGGKASDEAIAHVVLGPFFGWSASDWRPVADRSAAQLIGFEEALRLLGDEGYERAQETILALDRWRAWAATDPISQLSYRLIFETGLVDHLRDAPEKTNRVVRVFEDLQRLLTQMQDFETVDLDGSLASYLATFPKPPTLEITETLGDADGVQLLTVHASKGLEFDTVYLVGATARAWSPSSGANDFVIPEVLHAPSKLPPEHEERRLMYVAITRARRTLQLSAPAATNGGGQRQTLTPLIAETLGGLPELAASPKKAKTVDESMHKLQQFYPLKSDLPERLSFENSDGWIELGVGDLERYERSPHDFYLQNVLKISQPFGPQLAFGSAIHRAIQAYYQSILRGERAALDELLAQFDQSWSDRGYDSRELAEAARKRGYEAVTNFREREEQIARVVRSSEQPIRFEIPEAKLRLRGRIDATFEVEGGLEVRDFKTGNQTDPEKLAKKAKESFQLRTYALAITELTGAAPAQVTLDYVVTDTEGTASLTPQILKNHREKLMKLAERLRHRDFAPGPDSIFDRPAAYRYYGTEIEEEDSEEEAGL